MGTPPTAAPLTSDTILLSVCGKYKDLCWKFEHCLDDPITAPRKTLLEFRKQLLSLEHTILSFDSDSKMARKTGFVVSNGSKQFKLPGTKL